MINEIENFLLKLFFAYPEQFDFKDLNPFKRAFKKQKEKGE